MSAYLAAAAWVVARLSADTGVTSVVPAERIFEGTAPTSAEYPLILVQPYTDPADVNYNGSRAMTEVGLLVRVWDSAPESHGGSYARILPVDAAMDAALTGRLPEATALGWVAGCQRTAEKPMTDTASASASLNATVRRALGGLYTVTVAPAA